MWFTEPSCSAMPSSIRCEKVWWWDWTFGFPVVMVFPPKMGWRFSGAIFLGTLFPDKLMSWYNLAKWRLLFICMYIICSNPCYPFIRTPINQPVEKSPGIQRCRRDGHGDITRPGIQWKNAFATTNTFGITVFVNFPVKSGCIKYLIVCANMKINHNKP